MSSTRTTTKKRGPSGSLFFDQICPWGRLELMMLAMMSLMMVQVSAAMGSMLFTAISALFTVIELLP